MNNKSEKYIAKNYASFLKQGVYLCLFFFSIIGFSQSKSGLKVGLDKDSILIGEQLNYIINLEVSKTDQVIFPEGQTFAPLEMVESFAIDTLRENEKITLLKKYALTQFDSGAYTVPRQKILINEKEFLTDSLRVAVNTVVVDTIAQPLHDIKDIINVEKSSSFLWLWILAILLFLAIIAGLLYLFIWRKKKLTEEEKVALMPPYDRAMLELKKLENSKYLIQDEYKQYYSELTDIVRSYLEEDVHITALESTTDQLIEKLELMKDAGSLKLDNETLNQFKKILQTSDLVKFAKSKPELSVAEQDRKAIENIVTKTKEAIPPPTEEELLQQEEYLEELARKKHRKKIIITITAAATVLLISAISAIAYYGFQNVKDTVLGHPTKELLEGEWITSTYSFPPITLETPKVLVRVDGDMISNAVQLDTVKNEKIKKQALDLFKNYTNSKNLNLSEFILKEGGEEYYFKIENLNIPGKTPNLENEAKGSIEFFSKQDNIKNIIVKQEKYTTTAGDEGLKQFGSLSIKNAEGEYIKKDYIILNFATVGSFKRIIIIWNIEDIYAKQIVDRTLKSIDLKTE